MSVSFVLQIGLVLLLGSFAQANTSDDGPCPSTDYKCGRDKEKFMPGFLKEVEQRANQKADLNGTGNDVYKKGSEDIEKFFKEDLKMKQVPEGMQKLEARWKKDWESKQQKAAEPNCQKCEQGDKRCVVAGKECPKTKAKRDPIREEYEKLKAAQKKHGEGLKKGACEGKDAGEGLDCSYKYRWPDEASVAPSHLVKRVG